MIHTKCHKALVRFVAAQRQKRGLTQTQLAKRLKIDQNQVSRIENGQRRIDVYELIQLSKALEFNPHKALTAALKANAEH